MSGQPAANTDRELYREDTGDPAGSYYENSVSVTESGGICMNVGGTVICQPIAEWHTQALRATTRPTGSVTAPADGQVHRLPCSTCSGPVRETVGMVCQTCGTDYAPAPTPVRDVSTGQGEELRAAIARTIAVTSFVMVPDPEGGSYGTSASPEEVAHALLAGPLADLVAENQRLFDLAETAMRERRAAQEAVRRVEALVEEHERARNYAIDPIRLRSALGTEQQGRDR